MASISDLHTDILFNHLFLYLDTLDVWKLRLACSKMHELCWDYFENACSSLSLTSNEGSRQPGKSPCVGFGAGVNILQVANCKHLHALRITGKCNETEERNFVKLTSLLVEKDMMLKRLVLSDLDLSCVVSYVDSISAKCFNLEELELSRIVMSRTIQWFLQCLLQHNRSTLRKLVLDSLAFAPNDPLPTKPLTALQYFSVRFVNAFLCSQCTSNLA